MGYQYPAAPPGLLTFPVTTILLSIIFGWLRLRTGSIWPACVAHAASNVVGASMTVVLFMGGPCWILVSYWGGVFGWLPLAAMSVWIAVTGGLRPPVPSVHHPA
jgi:membrane protease YdiL (CAAX protease family)